MNLKSIAFFACGALTGFIGGIFVERRSARKNTQSMLKHLKDTKKILDGDGAETTVEDLREPTPDESEYAITVADSDKPEDRMSQYRMESPAPEEPEILKGAEDIQEQAPEESEYAEFEVYAITVADFMSNPKYEKVYCEYHLDNDTLVDVEHDIQLDPDEALGEMRELLIGWTGNVMYIRNTKNGTDYHIDFLPDSWGGGDSEVTHDWST